MKRTITLIIAGSTLIASLAYAGSYTVTTSPDQDAALARATQAKRGSFMGKDQAQLVQLMFDRAVKQYEMFLLRTGKLAATQAPLAIMPEPK